MTIKALALAAALAALTATSGLAATVQLNVVGGQLLGASNVDVNGTLYDVEFVDGTCIALFDGCEKTSNFAFTTSSQAQAAAESLSNSVFLNGPLGNFDSNPLLTAGISFGGIGLVLTPYRIDSTVTIVDVYAFANGGTLSGGRDISLPTISTRFLDLSTLDNSVYARFSPTPVPAVPLPAAGFMLIAGLAGLGALSRRRTPAPSD